MRLCRLMQGLFIAIVACAAPRWVAAQALHAPVGPAEAVVDLTTPDGVALVKGQWRVAEAKLVEVDFKNAGPDHKPTGSPNRTLDVVPKAGATDFDDAAWQVVAPDALATRLGTGRVSFVWYRFNVTVPDRVGGVDVAGSTLVFDTVVDDYAEVWVDGQLPRPLGQSGGSLIAGFNVPNRLVIARNVKPGQRVQLAIFAINGPLSDPPPNFIWMRSAKLEFHKHPWAGPPREVPTEIVRLDPALDAIVAPGTKIEQLATGFRFTEGPIWMPGGYLLFSDPNANTIYKWTPDNRVETFRTPSGYSGADIAEYGQPGSNGLTLDPGGRLVIDQHGNRRVVRLEADGREAVLADRYDGKRLNSPNDLVYRSDGTLFFTDPPFGLPKFHDDPRRELPYTGVFSVKDGKVQLATTDLAGPNGIAFAPGEKQIYVTNWDVKKKVVMRYDVDASGKFTNGSVFFDMGGAPGEEALDGLKVDQQGNLFVSGPGGLWIISPQGKQLGLVKGPELAANFAWGDADGKTLYLTARTGLYRIRLGVPGIRP